MKLNKPTTNGESTKKDYSSHNPPNIQHLSSPIVGADLVRKNESQEVKEVVPP